MRLKPAQKFTPFPSSIIRTGLWRSLSASAKAVYPCLLDRSDGNTCKCWPSYATIASDAGVCRASAVEAVKELVQKGLVVKTARYDDDGDPASNLYTMMVPDDDQGDGSLDDQPGSPENRLPQSKKQTTGSLKSRPERYPIERDSLNEDSLTGSADAEAAEHPPVQPPKPKEPKPDPYRSVIETYSLAGLPEPPSSEVTPLLRAMKQALASGWPPTRIAAAWINARTKCSPQSLNVWSLAYTLRHLTDAEAMQSKPPGSGSKPPRLSDDELEARARANAANVMGELYNDR